MPRLLRPPLLLVPLLAACASNDSATPEPIAPAQAEASVGTQELDPNDPNVEVCPVTGAMQLKSDAGSGPHGG